MEMIQPTNSPFDRLDSRVYEKMFGLALDFQHNWEQLERDLRSELWNNNKVIAEILAFAARDVGWGVEYSGPDARWQDIIEAYRQGGEMSHKALSFQSPYHYGMPRLRGSQRRNFCKSLEGFYPTAVGGKAMDYSPRLWMLGEKTYQEDTRFGELVADLSSIAVERQYIVYFKAGAGLVRLAVKYADEVPELEEVFSLRGYHGQRRFLS